MSYASTLINPTQWESMGTSQDREGSATISVTVVERESDAGRQPAVRISLQDKTSVLLSSEEARVLATLLMLNADKADELSPPTLS